MGKTTCHTVKHLEIQGINYGLHILHEIRNFI